MANATRVNIGCGPTPVPAWENFDNSPSVKLSRYPLLAALLFRLKLINQLQLDYVLFCQKNNVKPADASKRIPIPDDSVEVLYTSHMIGAMDDAAIHLFLKEARRVLKSGGIIRFAEPDLERKIARYNETKDADWFVKSVGLRPPRPRTAAERIIVALVGSRFYQTTFTGESLSRLLRNFCFGDIRVLAAGETRIQNPGELNLRERESESFYVEAAKFS